eukprot:CAMPEP_0117433012 /NCGR_PEP_ID=MMETSP0758-20121206/12433_1 /TAXON_ID=63605 /ORGANISM="Percolomonas cosmopolitus, Strain AE-1 (ATCC 50343)" /LENGTH=479 /DNA_ID=CAMNT_0005223369 /DNA_START=1290 /DNA_END=2725 /DNA_ORIENTATION=-
MNPNGVSLVRPSDPIEILTSTLDDKQKFAYALPLKPYISDISSYYILDAEYRRDVINLTNAISLVSVSHGLQFEAKLNVHSSHLLTYAQQNATQIVNENPQLLRDLNRALLKVQSPQPAFDILLDLFMYPTGLNEGDILSNPSFDVTLSQVKHSGKCVIEMVLQHLRARYTFARDFSLLLCLVNQFPVKLRNLNAFREKLSVEYLPRVINFLKLYSSIKWTIENDALLSGEVDVKSPLNEHDHQIRILVNNFNSNVENLTASLVDFKRMQGNVDYTTDLLVLSSNFLHCLSSENENIEDQTVNEDVTHVNPSIKSASNMLKSSNYNGLSNFCRTLVNENPLLNHFLGLSYFHQKLYDKVEEAFDATADYLAKIQSNYELIGPARHEIFSTFDTDSKTNIDWQLEAPNIMYHYYNKLRSYCTSNTKLSLRFSKLALNAALNSSVSEEEISILYSIIFTQHLKMKKYEAAYYALLNNPHPS